MSKGWERGSTRAWRRLRALVLARDRNLCQLHTQVCTVVATQVHHTLGKSVSGDDPRYLVAACAPCNQRVGDPTRNADPPNKGVTKW